MNYIQTINIIKEIKLAKRQSNVAMIYANAIGDDVEWEVINYVIILRWSRYGLDRVKRMAWKSLGGEE